jgi:hypothetical protein
MTLISILSALGGGLLRLLPELLALLNKKTDNSHELAMMDKQVQLEQLKGANRTAEIGAQHAAAMSEAQLTGDINFALKAMDATAQALHDQMQKVGVWWVDALNVLVRPLTTYYFLGCYGIVKTAMIVVALRTTDPWVSIIQCWSPDDAAILWGILGFWFVGRTFEKGKK